MTLTVVRGLLTHGLTPSIYHQHAYTYETQGFAYYNYDTTLTEMKSEGSGWVFPAAALGRDRSWPRNPIAPWPKVFKGAMVKLYGILIEICK